jgi:hypothetical protein
LSISASVSLALSLLEEKIGNMARLCKYALLSPRLSLRNIVKMLGKFAWAIQAITFAQAHYRALKRILISETDRSHGYLESKVDLDAPAKRKLTVVESELGKIEWEAYDRRVPDYIIFSGGCLSGWRGGHIEQQCGPRPMYFPGFDSSHQ